MDTWEFFQDSRGRWRWRCTSADGNVVLNSAAGYLLPAHAVANAITHGFVEGGSRARPTGARDGIHFGGTDHLEALKLRYEKAFSVYESCLSALSDTWSPFDGLGEDVARALRDLESARRDYSDALFQTAFGDAGAER